MSQANEGLTKVYVDLPDNDTFGSEYEHAAGRLWAVDVEPDGDY